jgi:hypothetical protein
MVDKTLSQCTFYVVEIQRITRQIITIEGYTNIYDNMLRRVTVSRTSREVWRPPTLYLAAIERAHRPEAGVNERLLAHIIDALLVVIMCQSQLPILPDKRK